MTKHPIQRPLSNIAINLSKTTMYSAIDIDRVVAILENNNMSVQLIERILPDALNVAAANLVHIDSVARLVLSVHKLATQGDHNAHTPTSPDIPSRNSRSGISGQGR